MLVSLEIQHTQNLLVVSGSKRQKAMVKYNAPPIPLIIRFTCENCLTPAIVRETSEVKDNASLIPLTNGTVQLQLS